AASGSPFCSPIWSPGASAASGRRSEKEGAFRLPLRRQHLEQMPRGIAEIKPAPAIAPINRHVLGREGAAAIGDARVADPREDTGVDRVADLEGVVMHGEIAVRVEVERQAVVD